ncbi:hypothetical protein TSUD_19200 [Trifolium subterraneum]|uniref:Uncharacterized protein n=1 Tax=Trifolium subterraneum TaxID=3900 RepID=A0A2Z6N650_TRISU|nr:hypothetical protein TSUD_19200 [Trifolium subterraneum]
MALNNGLRSAAKLIASSESSISKSVVVTGCGYIAILEIMDNCRYMCYVACGWYNCNFDHDAAAACSLEIHLKY